MNKKGFTLVELLAILAILGIIITIAVPNINKQIKKGDEETQKVLNNKIENAAKLYVGKYYANKIVDGDTVTFTLNELVTDGLLYLNNKECESLIDDKRVISIDSDGEFDYSNVIADDCYVDE